MPYFLLALGVVALFILLGCVAVASLLVLVEVAASREARPGAGESA